MFLNSFYVQIMSVFIGCQTRNRGHNHQVLSCSSLENFYSLGSSVFDVKEINIVGRSGARETLKEFSFVKYGNLTKLRIENTVYVMELGAFDGLHKIEDINLGYNHFPILRAKLFDLVAISLRIENCNVQEMEPGAFGNIRNIYINSNNIPILRKGVFTNSGTSGVQLKSNGIRFIDKDAFSGMENLRYLDLSDNELLHFNGKELFGDAGKLIFLDLSKNKLVKVEKNSFSTAPDLEMIILAENSVEQIDREAFQRLERLELLDLSNNLLKEIHSDTFKPHHRLQTLLLDGNNVTLSPDLLEKTGKSKDEQLQKSLCTDPIHPLIC